MDSEAVERLKAALAGRRRRGVGGRKTSLVLTWFVACSGDGAAIRKMGTPKDRPARDEALIEDGVVHFAWNSPEAASRTSRSRRWKG